EQQQERRPQDDDDRLLIADRGVEELDVPVGEVRQVLVPRTRDLVRAVHQKGRRRERGHDHGQVSALVPDERPDYEHVQHGTARSQDDQREWDRSAETEPGTTRVGEVPGDICAEHEQCALREVEDADRPPDERQAAGHERVQRARDEAGRQNRRDRRHVGIFPKYISRTSSCAIDSPRSVSSETRPCSTRYRRPQTSCSNSTSWSTTIIVTPDSAISLMAWASSSLILGARPRVGSSSMSNDGMLISPIPIDAIWRCPPLSVRAS